MTQAVVSKHDCNSPAHSERKKMPLIADTDTVIHERKTIGLLDHLGGGNLGDDATLQAVMQNIKSRWPDAKIVGLSMNPDDTQRRHGIAAYPIRRPILTNCLVGCGPERINRPPILSLPM